MVCAMETVAGKSLGYFVLDMNGSSNCYSAVSSRCIGFTTRGYELRLAASAKADDLTAGLKYDRLLRNRRNLHRRTRVATDDSVSADENAQEASPRSAESDVESKVRESVATLKIAAKTRKVPGPEVFAAIRCLEKARLDPSSFLETIGGNGTPRTWMLIFTAGPKVVREALKGGPGGGRYFPVTAVQQFDAATKSIQNGLYLRSLGVLEFMGKFEWDKNKLFFFFDTLSIKLGPLGPFKLKINKQEREPNKKDPFFIWYYADEEIIVGKGRGGGVAFWVRCARVGK